MTDVFGDICINHLSSNELAHDIDYFQKTLSQLLQNLKKNNINALHAFTTHKKKNKLANIFVFFGITSSTVRNCKGEKKNIFVFLPSCLISHKFVVGIKLLFVSLKMNLESSQSCLN